MAKLFEKILIANRGEIACRVIASCRELGVATVAVHSQADQQALHVQQADEAVPIGPAPSAESYLVIDKIIDACKRTGAQAVHPGFGFLSENSAFVEALDRAGIVFIGPPTGAIAAMGDKITSKKLAAEAGVSTVPGYMGAIADADEAARISADIGYPVMIKATAGGGGKGMRVAHDEAGAREGFRSAQNEARSSFGDERVFIEKFIEEPRHIEIQVLADAHGNTVYLGERECSIQRRHQKVIEEAPSPFLDEATRRAMGEQAVALAKAVDYRSAGTVEFIVDKERNFYFLEMNTRIQVEHPVTEMITGLDLVGWMIRIAAGEALDFSQDQVTLNGWSIEARVYAEDPLRDFLPSIGRLVNYQEPQSAGWSDEEARVRIDSGVAEGSEISMYYDPMIAKLVTHAPDRDRALAAMRQALDGFVIRGIKHNIAFLAAVITSQRFAEGRLSTNFIAEEFPDGFSGHELDPATHDELMALAAALQHRRARRVALASELPPGTFAGPTRWVVIDETRDQHAFQVIPEGGFFRVRHEESGVEHEIVVEAPAGSLVFHCTVDGRERCVQLDRRRPAFSMTHEGASLEVLVLRPRAAELARHMPVKQPPDLSKYLLSPMPGLLVSLAVEAGQAIKAGDELAVVEAMKMENVLRADKDGTVLALRTEPGDSLSVDQVILEFE
jgi:propionyl-CoA carboxylase alpha chain